MNTQKHPDTISSENIYSDNRIVTLSIITVTFNAGEVLDKTLQSIFNQTYDDYELIIIDGNSTDNTIDIIHKYSSKIAHWVSEPDNGIYDAMNKGISFANGEYLQFLNAGDHYCDNHVLADVFSDTSRPTLIYGDINILRTNGEFSYQNAGDFTLDELLKRGTGVLCHQAMFVRRSMAPLYDSKYRYKGELNWYFDIVEKEGFTSKHIQRPIVFYSLGGLGYRHFIRNRLEWVWLIFHRYGIITVFKSKIIIFLLKNSISRYPVLYNPAKLLKRAGLLLKRI